jgi:hypothetical protein
VLSFAAQHTISDMCVVLMQTMLLVFALCYSVNYCSAAIAPRNPYKPRRRVRKHTADSSAGTAIDKAAVPGYPYIAAVTNNAAFVDTESTGDQQQQQQQQREQRKMSDSVTAQSSQQQQHQRAGSSSTLHPVQFVVGLTLLLPIVLVQGVLLMVPLRLAAALNQRNSSSNNNSSSSNSSSKGEEQQQHSSASSVSSSATGGASPRHSDSPIAAAAADAVGADDVILGTTSAAADNAGPAAGDSSTSESQQANTVQQQEAADALPRRIRANFAAAGLSMQRVDVMLPAANTHGAIIVRRGFYKNSGGQDVVRHIATAVLHLEDSSNQIDSPTATSPATSEGLNVTSVALEVVEATAEGAVGA